jgi:hypothetical protein
LKYATWTYSDIGEGRPHAVVAELPGAVPTPDGLVDAPVLVLACGRVRPAEGAALAEADEAPENAHKGCVEANGRLVARSRSAGTLVVVAVTEGSPVLGEPTGASLN